MREESIIRLVVGYVSLECYSPFDVPGLGGFLNPRFSTGLALGEAVGARHC